MTREEVLQLLETSPLPKKRGLGTKRDEEVYIAEKGEDDAETAKKVLKKMELLYQQNGWLCPAKNHSGVFQDADGKWYAYRQHAKYS